eukprot:2180302-Ditylum_brightwellii.AAC.1
MAKIVSNFAKAITACPLSRAEVIIAYKTILLPSLTYSIPLMALTTTPCEKINAILYPRLLARLGYNSSFPQAVAFASKDYGRIELYHIKALHIYHQIDYLLKHIRTQTVSGRAALCLIRWGQLCA